MMPDGLGPCDGQIVGGLAHIVPSRFMTAVRNYQCGYCPARILVRKMIYIFLGFVKRYRSNQNPSIALTYCHFLLLVVDRGVHGLADFSGHVALAFGLFLEAHLAYVELRWVYPHYLHELGWVYPHYLHNLPSDSVPPCGLHDLSGDFELPGDPLLQTHGACWKTA